MTCVYTNKLSANGKQRVSRDLLVSRSASLALGPSSERRRRVAQRCMTSTSSSEHQRIRIGNLLSLLADCTLDGHVRIRSNKESRRSAMSQVKFTRQENSVLGSYGEHCLTSDPDKTNEASAVLRVSRAPWAYTLTVITLHGRCHIDFAVEQRRA
jgi:hypothetical protein